MSDTPPLASKELCREKFEEFASDLGLCMDEIFMSSTGVPENPFKDCDTNCFYRAWLASWKACEAARATAEPQSAASKELVAELLEALESIRQYANDTLSGRVDGPDDREWQRACVAECRNRARDAIAKVAGRATAEPLPAGLWEVFFFPKLHERGVFNEQHGYRLRVTGPFHSEDERRTYCEKLAAQLNGASQPQPAAPSELVATLREIAVRALAVGPKDHNITLDEIGAISDAAERLAQPPGIDYRSLYLETAAKLDRERLGVSEADNATLLERVCDEWVNGRRVLDGITKTVADEVRTVLTKEATP